MNYGYDNQYSTTSYGANGGAGAGGFMANGSQDVGGAGGGSEMSKDSLRPVTIKQLNEAVQPHPDASFKIDDVEIGLITCVGQIRNISTQVTNHTYKIDDGTGNVEVKMWIDADPDDQSNQQKNTLQENDWVRIFGSIKQFNNKRHVGARPGGIKPITDMNEVNYHMLESTAVHLYFTRGPPESLKAETNGNGSAMQVDGQSNGAVVGGRQLPPGLSSSAKRVFQCIKDMPMSNEGMHMHDIASRLNMDMSEIGKAGDELLSNALIYTTVDDSTWAILDEI